MDSNLSFVFDLGGTLKPFASLFFSDINFGCVLILLPKVKFPSNPYLLFMDTWQISASMAKASNICLSIADL